MAMRSIKIAGLALASMLVMGMALAGSASATTLLWLVCLKGTGLTKYTNEKCLEASGGGSWQSLGVPTGVSITVRLLVISLLLSDLHTLVGNVAIRCLDVAGNEGEGLIKANGEGEVRTAKATNCEPEEHCEKVEKVEGVNLPWKIRLFPGANGDPLSKIESFNKGAGKEPGWKVVCKELGSNVEDRCESEKEKEEEVKFLNFKSATELLVIALFEEKHPAECTVGGKEAGLVHGSIAILLPKGALSIITSP